MFKISIDPKLNAYSITGQKSNLLHKCYSSSTVPKLYGTRSTPTTNATSSWSHKAGDSTLNIDPTVVVISIVAGIALLVFIILGKISF